MLALAYGLSTNRKSIRMKTVGWGLGLQLAFAIFVLRVDVGRQIFQTAGDGVNRLLSYAFAGSEFVFGEMGKRASTYGFYFAFQVLPTIIFIAAFFAILYHYGVMQFIIKQVARVMTRFMGASGAESLNVAASIFMGRTEARDHPAVSAGPEQKSELMTVMTSGMAHVSGGIMAAYIAFGIDPETSVKRGDYDGAGNDPDLEDAGAGDQGSEDGGARGDERRKSRLKSENLLGAIAAQDDRWIASRAEYRGDADLVLALIALANGILGGIHNLLAARGMGGSRAAYGRFWEHCWRR
jgi:CNT family concentrative nucleoside transporter